MPDDTLLTELLPPVHYAARARRVAGHRVLWFAVGTMLWILNAGLASVMLGVSRAIWHW